MVKLRSGGSIRTYLCGFANVKPLSDPVDTTLPLNVNTSFVLWPCELRPITSTSKSAVRSILIASSPLNESTLSSLVSVHASSLLLWLRGFIHFLLNIGQDFTIAKSALCIQPREHL